MASKINADEFVDREGEGKPTLPKGVVLSGVTTITTAVVAENEVANSTGINAGIITSTHFAGNLTGDVNAGIVTVTSQTVVGSAVTISASGIDIGAGVITATSYVGAWGGTGIGATIMIWEYNPDPGDMQVPFATGIGLTFNQKIKAGSGNITLREDSASGTVVENFGIGSSVTINNNELTITPTSDLSEGKIYHLSYPSGVITNMAGESYVGTAYTFKSLTYDYELWMWGRNNIGQLGDNSAVSKSSPVQIPGTTWRYVCTNTAGTLAVKTDGSLWAWGENEYGLFGTNQATNPAIKISSPVQVGSETTWSANLLARYDTVIAVKTDGTLWTWGRNWGGEIGNNTRSVYYSSPVQIPGTTWKKPISSAYYSIGATKTDGTLWAWGYNGFGQLAQNNGVWGYSSPVQIPGTDWANGNSGSEMNMIVTKTDGTLWAWGKNEYGQLAQNNRTSRSSPTQIPGSTWSTANGSLSGGKAQVMALKTDGTLWFWGYNKDGMGGNNVSLPAAYYYSSPVQVLGSNYDSVRSWNYGSFATRTDGTLWSWGSGDYGGSALNRASHVSSPIQIGTDTTWWKDGYNSGSHQTWYAGAIKRITP